MTPRATALLRHTALRAAPSRAEVKRNWDAIKREEKQVQAERRADAGAGQAISSVLDGVVARARELGLDPELKLRAAARGYRDRVHA